MNTLLYVYTQKFDATVDLRIVTTSVVESLSMMKPHKPGLQWYVGTYHRLEGSLQLRRNAHDEFEMPEIAQRQIFTPKPALHCSLADPDLLQKRAAVQLLPLATGKRFRLLKMKCDTLRGKVLTPLSWRMLISIGS